MQVGNDSQMAYYMRVNGMQIGNSSNQNSMSEEMLQAMQDGGMPPMMENSNGMGGMPPMQGNMPPPPPPPPSGGQEGGANPLMNALSSLTDEEAEEYVSNLQSLSSSGKEELKSKLDELREESSDMSMDEINSSFLSIMDEVFSNSDNFTTSTGVLYNSYA